MTTKMTPKEAISYIENYGWSTTRLGLDRTRELFSALGNPQSKLKFIHVAGSNGKGSTCAMLASILKEAGYKTGLYISPYIEVFNERIQINGEYIEDERLAEITERVKLIADSMEDHPSQFELVTAIAIQYYYEEECDIVVLEVGMGGKLDSTNAIDSPEVAVITNIGLEHTEYLGNSLEEIAETKGGIIKPGSNCVCYDGEEIVSKVIERICLEKKVPLRVADFSKVAPLSSNLDGQSFVYCEEEYRLSLLGGHQLNNVSVVLETIDVLRERGWNITTDAVKSGLSSVKWPARFEVLNKKPLFILDGGHNPQCAEALVESIKEYLPDQKVIFLLGVLKDKDYESIINMMMPYSREFICVTPLSERALKGEELAKVISSKYGEAKWSESISEGILLSLREAAKLKLPVIAFGSLYLAGAVRTEFKEGSRALLRSYGIASRNALTEYEKVVKSIEICKRIMETEEYKRAKNILIYKWTKGEVRLDYLEEAGEEDKKLLCYPLCLEKGEMIALKPGEEKGSWKVGEYGILEPNREMGMEIDPKDLDLVICPLAAFDDSFNRMGMGGGYYDRFLPKCKNAIKIGAAFSDQRIDKVPSKEHDFKLDFVITEE